MTDEEASNEQTAVGRKKILGRRKWEKFGLPADMSGKTFLDVGCWEGANCAEAVRRGADQVVGVDMCTSRALAKNVERHGFEFVQMDVLSEKWLELDDFDVVLCSGVLYHVENVISLLLRLRRVTGEMLALETATRATRDREPVLVFRPDDEVTNPSNWWFPNKPCLYEMLKTCGFDGITDVFERKLPKGSRLCVHAFPTRRESYERALPRKVEAMSLQGGGRWHHIRRRERGLDDADQD
jgi:SAM-dependent methyltransferase